MENPNKIEIEGLKTIHKLCNFGAEHDMEGCSFTEIVERMFSKIKSMQTQVNTLDEMLLNQGDALAEAKAQAVPEGFVLMPKEPNEAIKRALSYQCFDFISVANVYRNLGFDIPKKAEGEQSFFLHKFLLLAITHGNDFVKVFNEETKAMVEAQEQSHD